MIPQSFGPSSSSGGAVPVGDLQVKRKMPEKDLEVFTGQRESPELKRAPIMKTPLRGLPGTPASVVAAPLTQPLRSGSVTHPPLRPVPDMPMQVPVRVTQVKGVIVPNTQSMVPPSPPRYTLPDGSKNLLEELRVARWEASQALPKIAELEGDREALRQVLNSTELNTESLISELRVADDRSKHIEHYAQTIVAGVHAEEMTVVNTESQALLRHAGRYDSAFTQLTQEAEAKFAAAMQEKDVAIHNIATQATAELTRVRLHAESQYQIVCTQRDGLQAEVLASAEKIALLSQGSQGLEAYVAEEYAGRMTLMITQNSEAVNAISNLQHEVSIRDDAIENLELRIRNTQGELGAAHEASSRITEVARVHIARAKEDTRLQGQLMDNERTECERLTKELQRHGAAIVDVQRLNTHLKTRVQTLESDNAHLGSQLSYERRRVEPLHAQMPSFEPRDDQLSRSSGQYHTPENFNLATPVPAPTQIPIPRVAAGKPGGGPPAGEDASGDGDDSSEYASDVSEKEANDTPAMVSRRTKLKKQWKKYNEFNHPLVLPPVPENARGFKTWKDKIRADVSACSKADDKAWRWMMRFEDKEINDDDFKKPSPKWRALDSRIRAALMTNLGNSPIGKLIGLKTEEERMQNRRQIAGGYMLRLIYRHFQTKDSLSQFYDFADVMKVTCKGDSHLADFMHQWNTTLNGLLHPEQVPTEVRKALFLKQIISSQVLKYDMEEYSRMREGDPNKTLDWLVERVMDRIKDERSRTVEQQLGYGGQLNPALAATHEVCQFFYAGNCTHGANCRKSHDIPPGYKPPPPRTEKGGDKGKGKGKGEKGGKGDWSTKGDKGKGKGEWSTKGGGKDTQKGGKGKGKGNGKGKGGDPNATTPCFRFNEGVCTADPCPHNHRRMTKEEKDNKASYDERRAIRRPRSPGAPATGPCSDFAAGNCALGDSCPMQHTQAPKTKGKAKAKAKAEAK